MRPHTGILSNASAAVNSRLTGHSDVSAVSNSSMPSIIARRVRTCRVLPRQVGVCRHLALRLGGVDFQSAIGRDKSGHAATGRRRHFLDIGDVLINRFRCDEIFFAKAGFDQATLQVSLGAVALDTSRSAGVSGLGVALKCVIDRESKIAVVSGRDRSRRVVVHCPDDNVAARHLALVIPNWPDAGKSGMFEPFGFVAACAYSTVDNVNVTVQPWAVGFFKRRFFRRVYGQRNIFRWRHFDPARR